jgi:hypothetical protein
MNYKELGFLNWDTYQFPKIINIEVYNGNCPCRCVHCPVGIMLSDPLYGEITETHMSLAMLQKITQEVANYPSSFIRIHAVGEPLLWENLEAALEIILANNISAWIFTCAVTADIKILEKLCLATKIIEVSVNSINSEDYLQTKGIDQYWRVLENIKFMHQYIVEHKLPTRLIVSRVESKDSKMNDDFIHHWRESGIVDDAIVRSYHSYNNMLEDIHSTTLMSRQPCLVHWTRFNIGVSGKAVVCFNELFKEKITPECVLGDINDENIEQIWHGAKLNNIRLSEIGSQYDKEACCRSLLPCDKCTSCQPLNGNKETSEHQINQVEEK